MSVIASVSSGLQGALLLARGRPEGVQLVEADTTAAIRSFWAIPLSLPAVICLKLFDWIAIGMPSSVPLALGRHLMLFVIGWLLFVLVSHHMASLLNKQAEWLRFIAVWSYCSVVENTLVALGGLPGALGAPSIVDQAAQLVMVGWAFWLEWYATRRSLQVGGWTSMVFLAADFALGLAMVSLGALFA